MMPVPVAPEALKEILENNLRDLKPDIALLPVNGRDEYRRSHNVPGNFHFEEAIALCHSTGIAYLIPHHYGMFEFNSVDPTDLQKKNRCFIFAGSRRVAAARPGLLLLKILI
jgi:hypothetical protein